jgi:hypothetical protein
MSLLPTTTWHLCMVTPEQNVEETVHLKELAGHVGEVSQRHIDRSHSGCLPDICPWEHLICLLH